MARLALDHGTRADWYFGPSGVAAGAFVGSGRADLFICAGACAGVAAFGSGRCPAVVLYQHAVVGSVVLCVALWGLNHSGLAR
jgi:hypothetical protein